jgi:hypothetical protein
VPQQDDFLFRGPFGKSAGQGERLQYGQVFDQRVLTGSLSPPDAKRTLLRPTLNYT